MTSDLFRRAWHGASVFCLLLFAAVPGRAGEMNFSPQDAARQASFLKEMKVAVNAARHKNRKQTQAALRRALLAGGYGISVFPSAAACGRPAFALPLWLLTAQAAIGDVAGAKETARNLGGAASTLQALSFIARTQTDPRRERKYPYLFEEAIPKKGVVDPLDAFDFHKHDYSLLQELIVAPSPTKAMATLREGLPYALAQSRADAARDAPLYDYLSLNDGLATLTYEQSELRDDEGVKRTLAAVPSPARRALILLSVAERQRWANDARAPATEKNALRLLTAIDRSDAQERACFYYQFARLRLLHKDVDGARTALMRCTVAARQLPDIQKRFDMLQNIVITLEMRVEDKRSAYISHHTAQDKRTKALLLCEMRDLLPQLPVPKPTPPNPPFNPRFAAVLALTSIANSLATDAEDFSEANATLTKARAIAQQEADENWRDRCLSIVERNEEFMARRVSPQTGKGQ